jgi:uncharacterized protein YlzI (FlbEa/FlbD family)
MLKITHHSGKFRWLNFEGVDSIDEDEQGHAVITMRSGAQHVASEVVSSVVAAMDEWYQPASSRPALVDLTKGKMGR